MDALVADLTNLAAVLVGGALLMVPVLGLTLRFTVPPILDSVARLRWASRPARETAHNGRRPGAEPWSEHDRGSSARHGAV